MEAAQVARTKLADCFNILLGCFTALGINLGDIYGGVDGNPLKRDKNL